MGPLSARVVVRGNPALVALVAQVENYGVMQPTTNLGSQHLLECEDQYEIKYIADPRMVILALVVHLTLLIASFLFKVRNLSSLSFSPLLPFLKYQVRMSNLPNNQSSSCRKQKATAADLSVLEKLDTIPALLSVCKTLSSHPQKNRT